MKIKDAEGNLLPEVELTLTGDEAKWLLDTIQMQLKDATPDRPWRRTEYVVKIFGGEA